jgi:hypothetical protein
VGWAGPGDLGAVYNKQPFFFIDKLLPKSEIQVILEFSNRQK